MTTIGVAWVSLTQSLAIIALILTAFGLMLGIVKPADALKHIGAILGIMVLLMLVPDVLMSLWSARSLWQWIGLAAIVIAISRWRRPQRQKSKQ